MAVGRGFLLTGSHRCDLGAEFVEADKNCKTLCQGGLPIWWVVEVGVVGGVTVFLPALCLTDKEGVGGSISGPGWSQFGYPQNKWWSLGWNCEGGGQTMILAPLP